jgi:hypothetical protein
VEQSVRRGGAGGAEEGGKPGHLARVVRALDRAPTEAYHSHSAEILMEAVNRFVMLGRAESREILELLLAQPWVNMLDCDMNGETVLHNLSSCYDNSQPFDVGRLFMSVQMITEKDRSLINVKNKRGETPLMSFITTFFDEMLFLFTSVEYTVAVVKALLEVDGVDVFTVNSDGQGLLEVLEEKLGEKAEWGGIYDIIKKKQDELKKQFWHGVQQHLGVGARARRRCSCGL